MDIILTTPDQLKSIIKTTIVEIDFEKNKGNNISLFTINQVAKRLGKAHASIKKLVQAGIIKTTKDGLITEQAINDYLQNK
ncbi:MAG TPA: hypothetical protein PKK00_12810 [Bacteroidales bacterium]|nr:hypothetical protein [Bacteroidales bacterium]HPS18116.1 hypothetical protein [Bacteroidales bacterium]